MDRRVYSTEPEGEDRKLHQHILDGGVSWLLRWLVASWAMITDLFLFVSACITRVFPLFYITVQCSIMTMYLSRGVRSRALYQVAEVVEILE